MGPASSYGERSVAINGLQAVDDTERFWAEWAGGIRYDGRWQDAVRRSLVTLKALTYEPSVGIVAAATTSLPETLGGSRNWDYRYCWIRDTSFTLNALLGAGLLEEARAWRGWVLRTVAGDPAYAQIMYAIDGVRRLPEYELPWLSGYEGASPVRVGNDAAGQLQLDVHGEVLAAAHVARTAGIVPTERGWELQRWLAEHLEEAWKQPDNGIWESCGERQHFVYSKVMCWVAFDVMVKGVERFGLEGPVDRWRAVREEIHADICEKGYDAKRGDFHPGVRFQGAGRLRAAHPARRVPPLRRRARLGHHRDDPQGANRRWLRAALPHRRIRRWPLRPRGLVPGLQLLAGKRALGHRPQTRGRGALRAAGELAQRRGAAKRGV